MSPECPADCEAQAANLSVKGGKTLRGIHGEEIPGVHLVSAYAHQAGAVLAQVTAPGKSQELAAAKAVLRRVSPDNPWRGV